MPTPPIFKPAHEISINSSLLGIKSQRQPAEKTYFRPPAKYLRFIPEDFKWVEIPKATLETLLKAEGFAPYTNGINSPLDTELARIVTRNQITYAGRLAGYHVGLHEFQGEPALVKESPMLIVPEPGKWDTLYKLFENNYCQEGHDQRWLLLGWIKHALEAIYCGKPSDGIALVLAGEVESGKSLFAKIITELLGRRFAQPYQWMIGQDNFNEEVFESPLQLIDDENADTNITARLRFGAKIKQMVAVQGGRCRGLHQKANNLTPLWRLLICVNMEPDRLVVLPPLDHDIRDKMLILRCYRNEMPMPVSTEWEKAAFWSTLMSELPAFIHYLLHEFEIPKELRGRFGVRYWHHPDVVSALREISPEFRLKEFLDRYFKRTHNPSVLTGKAGEIRAELLKNAGLVKQELRDVPSSSWMGRQLIKLKEYYPQSYDYKTDRKGIVWTIRMDIDELPPGELVEVK